MTHRDLDNYTLWQRWFPKRQMGHRERSLWQRIHIDFPLLCCLLGIISFGLTVLYSAANGNLLVVMQQFMRFSLALVVMFVVAQLSPNKLQHWSPWLYLITLGLLIIVLFTGHIGKGAQRWLNLGIFRFQPSELMKLALPMALSWFFSQHRLPPTALHLFMAGVTLLLPIALIAKQPDLGTAIIVAVSGLAVIIFAGINWRWFLAGVISLAIMAPIAWHFLHDYQRQRILTFLNPERDPLGRGYHIIQSKIAIGSGGIFGKGWLQGTQAHLNFLPEHATDFIYSVLGEEMGLWGGSFLLLLYLLFTGRCLFIAYHAQDNYCRLLASSLGLTFFISVFVNIGMVSGILPVVGLPLPLLSYGGTSVVSLMASFGMLMAISTHRKLITT